MDYMDLISKTLEETDKLLKPQETVWFNITKEPVGLYDSKIGGIPYFPKNMEYPTNKNGEPLILLAQLNFNNIPQIKNFPSTGILQFYIEPGDSYGFFSENGFKVIYHKDIIQDREQLAIYDYKAKKFDMPFKEAYKLTVNKKTEMVVDIYTEKFDDIFVEKFNEHLKDLDENEKELFNEIRSYNDLDDDTIEDLCQRNNRMKAHIGGYPLFTQYDPRDNKHNTIDYTILLFELDSIYNKDSNIDIMWGDCGIGNFFIKEDDLKNLDFSNVLYNWDCY